MTVLRCSRRLLKRMRRPVAATEPLHDNPLGPWYADIDFIDRQPYVLVMNAATSVTLVLPGRADDLRNLHDRVARQFGSLLDLWRLRTPVAEAELENWRVPPTLAANRDRSLAASMVRRRDDAWMHFAHGDRSAWQVAQALGNVPFMRKDLGRDFHFPLDLLRARLQPSAVIMQFPQSTSVN